LYKGPNNKELVVLIICLKPPWFASLTALTRSKTFLYLFKKADNIEGSFPVLFIKGAKNEILKLLLVHL
jgi:hypothetical protein